MKNRHVNLGAQITQAYVNCHALLILNWSNAPSSGHEVILLVMPSRWCSTFK